MGPSDFIFELVVTLVWEQIRGQYRERSTVEGKLAAAEAKLAAKLAAKPVRLGLGFSGRLKTTL